MSARRLNFAIANPIGEILLEGSVDEELGAVLFRDFEDFATAEDRDLLREHFLRGSAGREWWIDTLRTLETDLPERFAIAWSPELHELLEESRRVHSS